MQTTVDYRCFHPRITSEEAERQLKTYGTHGSFLCRRSEDDPNNYTLSILQHVNMRSFCCYSRNFSEVIHLEINYAAPYFSLQNEEKFDSPLDVIQHFLDGHGILQNTRREAIYLKNFIINKGTIEARWYHGGINPEVVEEMLLSDKGQNGSFLVRASYKSPGDYSLSVRVNDEIVSVKIFSKGTKFELGDGNQFDSVENLIEFYKKYPFSLSERATIVQLKKGIESDPNYVSAVLSHSRSFQRYLTPTLSQASSDDRWQPVKDVDWKYFATYTLTSYVYDGGKGGGLIEIIGTSDPYSLDLNGDPTTNDNTPSYFRLYKTFYIPELCDVVCFESVCHPGHFIQWNTVSFNITFYKGTPNVPPTDNRCIGWNFMESPTKYSLTAQSLRAWTTRVPQGDPSGFFFYFGPPDNQSTDNEDYVPGLTPSFKSACAVVTDCKLDCPITHK